MNDPISTAAMMFEARVLTTDELRLPPDPLRPGRSAVTLLSSGLKENGEGGHGVSECIVWSGGGVFD